MLCTWSSIGSTRRFVSNRRVPQNVVLRLAHRRHRRRTFLLTARTVLEPSLIESDVDDGDREKELDFEYDPLTTKQVKALVRTLCEETTIAQLHLRLGSYAIKIQRSGNGGIQDPQIRQPSMDVVNSHRSSSYNGALPVVHEHPESIVEKVSEESMEGSVEDSFAEEDSMASIDESLMLIDSPKVGFFRHGVFNKNGKKVGKGPMPGDEVKAGQSLCAIEQLGIFTPILAPQQGEVLAFPFTDGEPVAYKDAVVEFSPYFGGHIIGDKKYA